MQVEKISNTQIRFIFNSHDLAMRNMNIENVGQKGFFSSGHNLLQEIATYVQSDPDFVGPPQSLMFEASLDGNNGIVVLVTKVQSDTMSDCENNIAQALRSLYEHADAYAGGFANGDSYSQRPTGRGRRTSNYTATRETNAQKLAVYEFENFDILVDAIVQIPATHYLNSSLYKLDGKYFLAIESRRHTSGIANSERYAYVLREYAKKVQMPLGKLNERAELLLKNTAIAKLHKYADSTQNE